MTPALQSFLSTRLPLPGIAAWGLRLADRSLASHCYTDWFVPKQIEIALTLLALATENCDQQNLKPIRLCWTFEHARIFVGLRPDGSGLALFVENRAGLSTDEIDSLLRDFTAMQPPT